MAKHPSLPGELGSPGDTDTEAVFNGAAYCLGAAAGPRVHPDKTALVVVADKTGVERERWSYGSLQSQVLRIAGGLKEYGLLPGARVLLRLGNSSDFPLLFFATLAAGAIAVPTSAMLTARECDQLVKDCEPSLIIHDGETCLPSEPGGAIVLGSSDVAALKTASPASYADTHRDDPAYLVYTSGTSGTPKGVLHAHRAIAGRAPMYRGWYDIGADDRLLHAGAFNWTYTLGAGLMDPWANGATSIVYDGERSPDIWANLVANSGATLFAAVPSLFRRMLKYSDLSADPLRTLRHGLTAGEALCPALHAEWLEKTGLPLFEAFGMSEISTFISSSSKVPARPGSVGRVQAGRRIAILPETGHRTDALASGESGMLCVHRSDPGLMLGYWRDEAATEAAWRGDWFLTGDRAHIDQDGYVWHEGRADDVMNAFGYRVAPDEIERVLSDHPDIAEAAVTDIAVGDEIRLITGFLVLAPGADPDLERFHAWCRERLADYKRPKQFVLVDTLPRTASGKLRRRALAVA